LCNSEFHSGVLTIAKSHASHISTLKNIHEDLRRFVDTLNGFNTLEQIFKRFKASAEFFKHVGAYEKT
jgi:hypothetical protein